MPPADHDTSQRTHAPVPASPSPRSNERVDDSNTPRWPNPNASATPVTENGGRQGDPMVIALYVRPRTATGTAPARNGIPLLCARSRSRRRWEITIPTTTGATTRSASNGRANAATPARAPATTSRQLERRRTPPSTSVVTVHASTNENRYGRYVALCNTKSGLTTTSAAATSARRRSHRTSSASACTARTPPAAVANRPARIVPTSPSPTASTAGHGGVYLRTIRSPITPEAQGANGSWSAGRVAAPLCSRRAMATYTLSSRFAE